MARTALKKSNFPGQPNEKERFEREIGILGHLDNIFIFISATDVANLNDDTYKPTIQTVNRRNPDHV